MSLMILALFPLQACESDELPVYGYRIVNVFPHDENAFTQGLFFRDGWLYESTGQRGASSIRKVHIDTGRVGQQYDFAHRYFRRRHRRLGRQPCGGDVAIRGRVRLRDRGFR